MPMWARIVVLLVGSVGVPALLYVSVEKPLMQVGRRVARRMMRPPVYVS
jgi:peptidoglycan/LPS O-acetylase OafA/YrhL